MNLLLLLDGLLTKLHYLVRHKLGRGVGGSVVSLGFGCMIIMVCGGAE
jgi:hypothetical protein